jgi:hypothetical protein
MNDREDRRRHPRERMGAACKVYHAASGRYLAGRTRDVSRSGVMIELAPGPRLESGDALAVGMGAAALLGIGDLIAGKVVWSEGSGANADGTRRVAVEFDRVRQGEARRP